MYSSHSLEAAVEGDHPLENVVVTFQVTSGPNNGTSGTGATDAVGHANFSYTGTGGPGVDKILATFVASDGRTIVSNSARKEWTVQQDSTPPVITSLTTSAPTLWPPNHKMVRVTVTAVATDDVSTVTTRIVSATSNEPDDGLGDGDTAGDIEIIGPMTLNLRAERSGKGNGRNYTITVEASDEAGNTARSQAQVRVPHSR